VTRDETDRAVDQVLAAYKDLGATIVADDYALCRLLEMLELPDSGREVGEYLGSFLIA
jgi:hypothetical protein